jgi:hypothetical protein
LTVAAGEHIDVVYRDVEADLALARRGSKEGWVPCNVFK